MNEQQFQRAAGISAGLAARWFSNIDISMKEFGITEPLDQAMFIAQMGHESGGFTRLVENLNYSADSLVPTFGKHRITAQQSAVLGRTATQPADQRAIANLVYGGEWGKKNLGNQVVGDGWKYRGRGLKQITGLANYRDCGIALKVDLITHPELLEQDLYSARSAAWFFTAKGCLKWSGDLVRVTQIINGGQNGIDDRKARYLLAKSILV
ncbi:glycoside hydrolase family 19 protein [Klebsiella variicola]|uniref:glycoside hydrolase family 19 protein n=1 Tax=Klebsiella pneumoniae complex TaxID=3390273 RepID=UPI000DE642A1|nr:MULTISPECIES: glycoside hydrolase family 19 protein [Klebsiella]EIV7907349.1 glycoside hydrolase family 19 protein [Klebsiella pneumoniae]MBQ5288038.1 glycoside hydrolase family 19 protein [Klebsiella pneumoniae]MBS2935748.1 glycoside hydrolase family 19 protein [Klebsiella pneumoniae]MBV0249746.1 glycoside hydrolase family 19 protein [Klebsiella pneumoniae]MBV0331379.1 glycoside hydrolase family 19 protein [Klebsiella pneumoniae]